jgi:hypothetical protein
MRRFFAMTVLGGLILVQASAAEAQLLGQRVRIFRGPGVVYSQPYAGTYATVPGYGMQGYSYTQTTSAFASPYVNSGYGYMMPNRVVSSVTNYGPGAMPAYGTTTTYATPFYNSGYSYGSPAMMSYGNTTFGTTVPTSGYTYTYGGYGPGMTTMAPGGFR